MEDIMEQLQDNSKYGHLIFKNVDRELTNWFESVIQENKCNIERKEWKSKYNSYVVYDYEPFCSDGFEINYLVSSFDYSYLNFVRYLYDEKKKTLKYLDTCLEAKHKPTLMKVLG